MQMTLRSALFAAAVVAFAPGAASARTGVLVLRDGMQSEYAFCREDEWGGWGKRHPVQWMFRAGLLDYAHRFERYLADSPGLDVRTLDLEAHKGELPLGRARLVIVDDVRASVLKPVAAQLADFVDRGGSLIFVGGFQGFGGEEPHYRFSMTKTVSDYRESGIAHILPLEITASPDYMTTAKPKVEFAGGVPLGTGLDAAAWPLHGFHRVVPRPTARVLATIDRAPLVAWHAVGRGYVVAFTGSELEAAFAAWNADPWPDEAAFWQRMAALALDALDVRVAVRVPPSPGPTVRVEAEVAAAGQASRTVRVEGWVEDADGEAWPLRGPESLRVEAGKSATWAAELPLKDVPPGPYRAFVRAADASRDGALFAASAPFSVEPPEGGAAATRSAPDSVRRGAPLKGEIELQGAAELRLLKGRKPLAALPLGAGTNRFQLATAGLRPGVYRLDVVADRPLVSQKLYVADYDPHFQNLMWWGQGDFTPGSELRRRMAADLVGHRVGAGAPTDLCERLGIWSMQSTGGIGALSRFAGAAEKPESQWMDASGKRNGVVCFNDPLFNEALPGWAASLAEKYKPLHSLGIVHIEDEQSCPDCYCEDCQRLFKEQYGYEMPKPSKDASPEFFEKWLARMDFKLATFGRYHKAVHDEFKKHLPHATVLTSLPQGFTVMCGETVLDHQRDLDAFWEHTYPGTEPLGAALAAHRVDMAGVALGVPRRPFIHLLQGFDEVSRSPKMPPREYMRLITWMAVAHGADHIGWFVYRWMWWHMPGTEAWEGAAEMARLLERYAPAFEQLQAARYPVALLYPLSQECGDYLTQRACTEAELPQRDVWVWRTWHSYEDAYFALKFAHVPFEPLYEETVLKGDLPYRAIVVPHADRLRKATADRLLRFIAEGGAVLLGASSTLELAGATKLPCDFLTLFNTYFPAGRKADWQKGRIRCWWLDAVREKAAKLAEALAPYHYGPLDFPEPEVVYNLRDGGDVTYLFLINDKTTNPLTAGQRELRGGYAHFAIMPMAYHPVSGEVTFKSDRVIVDVLDRRIVRTRPGGKDEVKFDVALGGGDARLFATLPEPIQAVGLKADAEVAAGEPLPVKAEIWRKGRLLEGVVPLEITLEAGGETRTLYAATSKGKWEGSLPTDVAVPPGPARLTVTELLTGLKETVPVTVTSPRPFLTTRP